MADEIVQDPEEPIEEEEVKEEIEEPEESPTEEPAEEEQPVDDYTTDDITSDDRLWAALSYPIPLVALIALLIEDKKERVFVRFHAVQSIVFNIILWIYSNWNRGNINRHIEFCIEQNICYPSGNRLNPF